MSTYALEGPSWKVQTITWSFAAPGGVFASAVGAPYQASVLAALARWTQVAHLNFQQVTDSSAADIRIGWGQFSGSQVGQTDYSYQLGGQQSFLPGVTVRLEDPAALALAPSAGAFYQGTSTTLYQVALHEIGHALGLAHSADAAAVMYPSLGTGNTDLDGSDIAGIQSLYGAAQAATSVANTVAAPAITLANNAIAVYRFFDSRNGTEFLTSSLAERNSVIASRPDLTYEGLGMGALATAAGDPNAVTVYRFFDTRTGSHFFTASQAEQAQIVATRPDLVPEQASFFEHAAKAAGDVPIYRFFNAGNGTHFFTASETERAALGATRPDMVAEGVAFYAPAGSALSAGEAAGNAAEPTRPSVVSVSDDTAVVYRFTGANGAQVLTSDLDERNALLAGRPDLAYDGVGLGSVSPAAGDDDAAPVFRFFDTGNGDHLLTASADEATVLRATRPDLVDEGVGFYEHLAPDDGDVPVYRFFDTSTGTHLYTGNEAERAALVATRPDLAPEGIAFYMPSV